MTMRRVGVWWLAGLTLVLAVLSVQGMWSVHPTGDGVEGMPTIVDLQLATSEQAFVDVLRAWSGTECGSPDLDCVVPVDVETHPFGIRTLKRNILVLDYAFPIAYSLLFVVLIGRLWCPAERVQRLLLVLAATTALADWLENSLHLWVLRGIDRFDELAGTDFWAGGIIGASVSALVKWLLIICAVAAIVAGSVKAVVGRLRST